mgnify:CR=1 FL=1
MKKFLFYFLLLNIVVFFASGCSDSNGSSIDDNSEIQYLSVQLRADAGSNQVTLNWQKLLAADTYNIYYMEDEGDAEQPSTDDLKTKGTKIDGVTAGIISAPYIVTGLENGKMYWFAISANKEGQDESDLTRAIYSLPVSVPPLPAPENVRANAGDGEVTVTWSNVTGATAYRAFYYTSFTMYRESPKVTGNTYTFTGLTNGQTYIFFVEALDNDDNTTTGDSGASFIYTALPSSSPPPFAPVITSVTADDARITITWNRVDATPAVTSYRIYIAKAKGVTKLSGSTTTITDLAEPLTAIATTGIENGTMYYIVITAINANGESAESVEWWAIPSATTPVSGN